MSPNTSASTGNFHAAYTQFLDAGGLKGARLGIVRNIPGFDAAPLVVLNYEFKANINRYFQSLGPNARIKSLDDLIAFNEQHRDRAIAVKRHREEPPCGDGVVLSWRCLDAVRSPARRFSLSR